MAVIDDLETRVRYHLRDTPTTDPRWTSEELKVWLADAEEQICMRSFCLQDNTTEAICKITMLEDIATYTISYKIIYIEEAHVYDGDDVLLGEVDIANRKELNDYRPTWRTDEGVPSGIVVTLANSIIVTPIPTDTEAGYYIQLMVRRRPLLRLTDANPVPEISSRYHEDMINWACHKAYLKDDVDTLDLKQAATFLRVFEASVGSLPSAEVINAMKQQPRHLQIQVRR